MESPAVMGEDMTKEDLRTEAGEATARSGIKTRDSLVMRGLKYAWSRVLTMLVPNPLAHLL